MKYIGYTLLVFIAIAAYAFKSGGDSVIITPSQKFIEKEFTVEISTKSRFHRVLK